MSAEFRIHFEDTYWFISNIDEIRMMITSLRTFVDAKSDREYWLLGLESKEQVKHWDYDVRLFIEPESIFLEISSHPKSIEDDLMGLFSSIRERASILILDEDGELSNW
ncbi:hypothetical protein [Serratia fonticola]|jgi:hypothetical protein|uniref:hypothetical protein n=1 Tax=Serratia fonticola TaxID=47917 RepID=UPI0014155523|nr:hypothetical protein [Serratia fonticola]QIP92003.1 hypothetical protein HAP32_02522 [Serratia fonticola]